MLETRPNLQKSLIGFGAFSFVFLAAMSGTAFMISGGFDLNPPEHAQRGAGDYVNLVQDTWSDWAAPPASAGTYAPAAYTPAAAAPDVAVFDDGSFMEENLDGSGDAATPTRDRTEEEVTRDIDAEYAAAQAQAEDRSANEQATTGEDADDVKVGEY